MQILCYILLSITVVVSSVLHRFHLPISFRVASLALGQSLPQCHCSHPDEYGLKGQYCTRKNIKCKLGARFLVCTVHILSLLHAITVCLATRCHARASSFWTLPSLALPPSIPMYYSPKHAVIQTSGTHILMLSMPFINFSQLLKAEAFQCVHVHIDMKQAFLPTC